MCVFFYNDIFSISWISSDPDEFRWSIGRSTLINPSHPSPFVPKNHRGFVTFPERIWMAKYPFHHMWLGTGQRCNPSSLILNPLFDGSKYVVSSPIKVSFWGCSIFSGDLPKNLWFVNPNWCPCPVFLLTSADVWSGSEWADWVWCLHNQRLGVNLEVSITLSPWPTCFFWLKWSYRVMARCSSDAAYALENCYWPRRGVQPSSTRRCENLTTLRLWESHGKRFWPRTNLAAWTIPIVSICFNKRSGKSSTGVWFFPPRRQGRLTSLVPMKPHEFPLCSRLLGDAAGPGACYLESRGLCCQQRQGWNSAGTPAI